MEGKNKQKVQEMKQSGLQRLKHPAFRFKDPALQTPGLGSRTYTWLVYLSATGLCGKHHLKPSLSGCAFPVT